MYTNHSTAVGHKQSSRRTINTIYIRLNQGISLSADSCGAARTVAEVSPPAAPADSPLSPEQASRYATETLPLQPPRSSNIYLHFILRHRPIRGLSHNNNYYFYSEKKYCRYQTKLKTLLLSTTLFLWLNSCMTVHRFGFGILLL